MYDETNHEAGNEANSQTPGNAPQPYQATQSIPNDKDGYATAILVLGIVSICCCAPCGIVALALRAGNIDQISPEKQGMVTAGFVTSIIGIVFWGIGLLIRLIMLAL